MLVLKRSFSLKKFFCLLGILVLFTSHVALAMQMAIEALDSIISSNYPLWPFADVYSNPSLISNPLANAVITLLAGLFFGILLFLVGIIAMKMIDDADF